jgi:hypothetical protein
MTKRRGVDLLAPSCGIAVRAASLQCPLVSRTGVDALQKTHEFRASFIEAVAITATGWRTNSTAIALSLRAVGASGAK